MEIKEASSEKILTLEVDILDGQYASISYAIQYIVKLALLQQELRFP